MSYNDYMRYIDIDPENARWKILLRNDQLVESIKEFRSTYGAGLKEAKDVVEEYRSQVAKRTAESNVREVRLTHNATLQIVPKLNGMFEVRECVALGEFHEHELLQLVATAAVNRA